MPATTEFDNLCEEGRRHVRHQDANAAIAAFQKALALDERAIVVHEGLAAAYFLKKDYENAAEHFKKVTLLDPRQAKALINLGAVYNRMGEYTKAVTILRKAVQKDKSSGEGHYNLGLAYRGLNQQAMAVSAYKEAVRVSPAMAAAHQNLANVYVDMGNFQHAMIHYKKALEINPEFERAQRGLEAAQEMSSQAKKSISPFGRLVDPHRAGRGDGTVSRRGGGDRPATAGARLPGLHRLAPAPGSAAWLHGLRSGLPRGRGRSGGTPGIRCHSRRA